MQEIAYNLRKIRTKQGLLQKELAQKWSVTEKFVSHVETGFRVPSLKKITELAAILNEPIGNFFKKIPLTEE